MTIAKQAAEAHQALRADAPRATQRTLEAIEIEHAIREHLRHARSVGRTAPEDCVLTTLRGGFVANNYGYRASADTVYISGRLASSLVVRALRDNAQSRRNGWGETLIHRARKPGQTQGRVIR